MNAFTLHGVGHLARDPEQLTFGGRRFTRIFLAANDWQDEDGADQERVTLLCMSAFGTLGEALARHAHKGDQLIVQARIATALDARSERVQHTFIVTGLRFGALGRATRKQEAQAAVPVALVR